MTKNQFLCGLCVRGTRADKFASIQVPYPQMSIHMTADHTLPRPWNHSCNTILITISAPISQMKHISPLRHIPYLQVGVGGARSYVFVVFVDCDACHWFAVLFKSENALFLPQVPEFYICVD